MCMISQSKGTQRGNNQQLRCIQKHLWSMLSWARFVIASCGMLFISAVSASAASSAEFNFTMSDFTLGNTGNSMNDWRGFKFTVNNVLTVSSLRGGATSNEFQVAIFNLSQEQEASDPHIENIMGHDTPPKVLVGELSNWINLYFYFPRNCTSLVKAVLTTAKELVTMQEIWTWLYFTRHFASSHHGSPQRLTKQLACSPFSSAVAGKLFQHLTW